MNATHTVRSLSVSARRLLLTSGLAPAAALLALASPASAYLGSFLPADGYSFNVPSGSANWIDVAYYNAGANGANAGGGVPTLIAPDSGRWSQLSNVGGFFTSSAARAAYLTGAPPYPTSVPSSNTGPTYIVGDHSPGRFNDGGALAVRNDLPAGSGALKYHYNMDTYDTGGPVPSSVTTGVVGTKFYLNPSVEIQPMPGARYPNKFAMSFMDSGGATGLQWGYARDNEVMWNNGGPWNYTGIIANGTSMQTWDGVNCEIDLTSQTFKLEYFIFSTSTWVTLAPAGTPLGGTMGNFSGLNWQMEDAVFGSLGGKNFFDDFSFNIPAPGTAALGAMGGLLLLRRRR